MILIWLKNYKTVLVYLYVIKYRQLIDIIDTKLGQGIFTMYFVLEYIPKNVQI